MAIVTRSNFNRPNLVGLFDDNDPFDDLLKGFFVRPVTRPAQASALALKLDVREDQRAYTVHVDLPGVRKEDVDVQVEGNLVTINALVKNEREVKEGEKVLLTERHNGRVSRSFQLAQEIDEAEAAAKLVEGVLELTLPKKQANETRRQVVIQ